MHRLTKTVFLCAAFVAGAALIPNPARAGDVLKMVVMASKSPEVEARKYKALTRFLEHHMEGIDNIELEVAEDYPAAVRMFQSGNVDGMFSGSFVAAVFIQKGIAVPVSRPLLKTGASTYRAFIIAPSGSSRFSDISEFKDKKIAYCALASSGEIFARGLLGGVRPEDHYTPMIVKSHSAAVKAVMAGDADFAIVKDLVYWASDYPETVVVGGDRGANPNNTLIVTPEVYGKYGVALEEALSEVELDTDDEAHELREVFNARGFIKTTEADFAGTYENMEKAKIDAETFDFTW